jgi:hypothetical protein
LKFAKFSSDHGSAPLEFLGFGLLLQIPVLVMVINLASIQHDQLVADAICRDSLRSYLLLGAQPELTAARVAAEYGTPINRIKLQVICEFGDCETEGNRIRVIAKVGLVEAETEGIK